MVDLPPKERHLFVGMEHSPYRYTDVYYYRRLRVPFFMESTVDFGAFTVLNTLKVILPSSVIKMFSSDFFLGSSFVGSDASFEHAVNTSKDIKVAFSIVFIFSHSLYNSPKFRACPPLRTASHTPYSRLFI
ncbi:hypothetical protein SAMN02799634_102471 [Bacillus sp. UNCCL13]|nr:hypothetical protein SAMN02799634_102471 [Bacillus sp. UNCCL13]